MNAFAPDRPSPGHQPGSGSRRYRKLLNALDLQALFLATVLALLVMSLGVNLFIFKQMRGARTQLDAARITVRNLTAQYQTKEPAMRQFIDALQVFGATHPDFQPILQRYRPALPQFFLNTTPLIPPASPRGLHPPQGAPVSTPR